MPTYLLLLVAFRLGRTYHIWTAFIAAHPAPRTLLLFSGHHTAAHYLTTHTPHPTRCRAARRPTLPCWDRSAPLRFADQLSDLVSANRASRTWSSALHQQRREEGPWLAAPLCPSAFCTSASLAYCSSAPLPTLHRWDGDTLPAAFGHTFTCPTPCTPLQSSGHLPCLYDGHAHYIMAW